MHMHVYVCLLACLLACLLGPTTYQKFYMSGFLILRRLTSCTQWVTVKKGIARVQCQLPGVEMTEVEAHMATYSLFATDHQWQVAHRQ